MKLSVIIVGFNSASSLTRCLQSITNSGFNSESEIFVVDNASSDNSCKLLRQKFPNVCLVANHNNVGFGRANNQALEQARGEFVLFLNPDTEVKNGALDHMVRLLEDRPHVGAVGPCLRRENGSVEISYGAMHSFFSEFWQKMKALGYAEGTGPLRSCVAHRARFESQPDWISGACLMTRRELMREIGGFDENYFLYVEDVDLCIRIQSLGFQIVYTPKAEVLHVIGQSVAVNKEKAFLSSKKSRLYFYGKHYGYRKAVIFKGYLWLDLWIRALICPSQRTLYKKTWLALQSSTAHHKQVL